MYGRAARRPESAVAAADPCPLCAFEETVVLQTTEPLGPGDRFVQFNLAAAGTRVSFSGCPRCAMVFRQPRPSATELNRYYADTLPPLEPGMMAGMGVTPALAAARYDVRYAGLFQELSPLAGSTPGHIADFGGWDGRSLKPWLANGWQATLVDPGAAGRPRVDDRIRSFSTAAEARAALPPAGVVTSYHCLEHLLDLGAWREEALSLGHPGTLWVIEVPFDVIHIRGLMAPRPMPASVVHEQHLNFFVPDSLRALGEHMGLDVEQVRIVVTQYWFGPIVGLRLVGRQRSAAPAALRPRFRDGAALRGFLARRLPLWKGWAGLKYRYFRWTHPPITSAEQAPSSITAPK